MKTFAYLLIIFGVLWCLIGGYYMWLKYSPNRLEFKEYSAPVARQVVVKEQKVPQRVIISDLHINLALIPAVVRDNKWDTTNDGASYLVSSPIPGNDGNSIIYGHNWASLFGNLVHARPGQKIEIEFSDKSRKVFTVAYASMVSPNQSSILAPSKDKRVTIYTCAGFLDSKRFVVVGIMEEDKKISLSKVTDAMR